MQIKNKTKGFTLVEMLFAIAILVVLSGAVLVSISSQRDKARVNRMFSEVSAVIPAIYMCIADGGTVHQPTLVGGNDLCEIEGSLAPSYGKWPVKLDSFSDYVSSDSANFNNDFWYVILDMPGISRVCCNKNMASCEILNPADSCSATAP
jgi:prepilin-type N-terminal cleavage/methylation domain-containing protein